MIRFRKVLDRYSILAGYDWRLCWDVNGFNCVTCGWMRSTESGSIVCSDGRAYADLTDFIASLPRYIPRIDIINRKGRVIRTYFKVVK